MPARNMGSLISLPANPATGKAVLMSPFSGPTGSPFDADQSGNASTGALNTGIGFGCNHVIGLAAPQSIKDAGFADDYTPGVTMPNGTAATLATLTCIGGGKSGAATNGIAATSPYAVQPLLSFGEDGPRDAGAGPEFTGFGIKMVTAAGAVAADAVIETGFVNRNTVALTTGQSTFGNSTTASAAVT